ncbi:intraflagellar transport protein 43 homolog A-like [Bolinopsis microptera]|uniref:intraflagellar transport protein 43 homolog A-like n=1 Tax=Bolinopsis microptera TaxID=2820187 RepID=UPI003079DD62
MSDIFTTSPDKKDRPQAGRRAVQSTSPNEDSEIPAPGAAATDSTMMLSPSSTDELSPPRPMPKQGGWGENTAVSMEDPRFNTQSPGEEISEIPTIPVLEEMAEEDLSFQVAEAPNVQVNRVATIRELDQELNKHSALMMLDSKIDLKCLTRYLNAESSVKESDKPWYWERLFTEVASELNSEWEAVRELENGDVIR